MKIERFFLILNMSLIVLDAFICGPNDKCFCNSNDQMDCSNTHIAIWKICGFINNTINYNIKVLHLERNSYENVNNPDFEGCEKLFRLYLGRNRISSIEKGAFTKLYRLELLDISDNNLPLYNEYVQEPLTLPSTITTLKLNGKLKANTSEKLSYPDLSNLPYLEELYMDGLRDKVFPVTYRKTEALKTVGLSGLSGNCNIVLITNLTLHNLPYVNKLNFSACQLENIYAGAFESLTYLETLDLSHNLRLGFRMLRNISYSLQFTNIRSLNYSKVHRTFSTGTQITKRDFCYFWNTSLTEIAINSNRVQLVETNTLILFPKTLKIVHAEDNSFIFGPYYLQWGCLSNVEEYYGSYQNIVHSPILYQNEPTDKHNEIVNDDVDYCPYMENDFLQNISIQNKNCPFFPNDKINLNKTSARLPVNCKRIELAVCNINFPIPRLFIFPPPKLVEYLDFSGNILHSWIGPVGPIPNLKYLKLSRNFCSYIGKKFFDLLESVEKLELQENFIGLVFSDENYGPYVFEKLVNVQFLNLSSNIISYLPPAVISRMSKLETLDLSVNNIEKWTINVDSLNNLLHLGLKSNSFRMLPDALRKKLESNTKRLGKQFTIDLRNNSFSTNCDEAEYLRWMVKHRNHMLYFNDYIFRDKTGEMISAEEFVKKVNNLENECKSYMLVILFTSVGISSFFVIVICGLIYKNRWKLRYLLRLTKIRHFGYKKLQNESNEPEDFIYDAFISYANEDVRFILDKIIPKLEEQGMKLCIHQRDFLPGRNIADNILDAIKNSKKAIVILSNEFLKSKWCLYEFNMARMESIYSREHYLLVVIIEDVPVRSMSNEMLQWIKTNTYIEYTAEEEGELLFWENLSDGLSR